jgi:hypothetical protein
LLHSTRERAMQRVIIIAIIFLGITAAQGQTVSPMNSQAGGGEQTNSGAQTSGGENTAVSMPTSSTPSEPAGS